MQVAVGEFGIVLCGGRAEWQEEQVDRLVDRLVAERIPHCAVLCRIETAALARLTTQAARGYMVASASHRN